MIPGYNIYNRRAEVVSALKLMKNMHYVLEITLSICNRLHYLFFVKFSQRETEEKIRAEYSLCFHLTSSSSPPLFP